MSNPKFGIRGNFVDTIVEVVPLGGPILERVEESLRHIREMEQNFSKWAKDLRQKEKAS